LSELAIRSRGITLAGWVANCLEPALDRRLQDANIAALAQRLDAPLLARLTRGSAPAHMQVALDRLDVMRATGAASLPLPVSY
jgi:dethiobiotin synthetase